MDCCYMSSKNLSKNQKRPEFFWFFALLQVRVPSKNQKTLSFFWVFSRSWPKKNKKNSRKTKKNQTWASDQTFSEKFWFFGFLVLSRFFVFGFSRGLASRIRGAVTSGPYLILVLQLCFPFFGAIYQNTFHYRPLVSTISLRKRLSPEYVRQFVSNFFLWRPDLFKGK